MVSSEWSPMHKSPASIDGVNGQSVHVQVNSDIDAHCGRARLYRPCRTSEAPISFHVGFGSIGAAAFSSETAQSLSPNSMLHALQATIGLSELTTIPWTMPWR